MTDIKLPAAVVEAAARAHAKVNEGHDEWWFLHVDKVTAALLAGLKAWPGMEIEMVAETDDFLVLPLTEKHGD